MSDEQDNIAILQETYRRYATEGIEPVLDRVSENVRWSSFGPSTTLPWCGAYHGREGVADFYRHLNEALIVQAYDVHQLIAQGDWIVALATATVRFKQSGRVEKFEKADIFRMENGRIAEFREYYDSAKALDALKGASLSANSAGSA